MRQAPCGKTRERSVHPLVTLLLIIHTLLLMQSGCEAGQYQGPFRYTIGTVAVDPQVYEGRLPRLGLSSVALFAAPTRRESVLIEGLYWLRPVAQHEVERAFKNYALRPAEYGHLVFLLPNHRHEVKNIRRIVALGTVEDGKVPFLSERGAAPELGSTTFEKEWPQGYIFLGVQADEQVSAQINP